MFDLEAEAFPELERQGPRPFPNEGPPLHNMPERDPGNASRILAFVSFETLSAEEREGARSAFKILAMVTTTLPSGFLAYTYSEIGVSRGGWRKKEPVLCVDMTIVIFYGGEKIISR